MRQGRPIFNVLQQGGRVSDEETHKVFNMGIGMMLIVAPDKADAVKRACGKGAFFVGEIVRGKGGCVLK